MVRISLPRRFATPRSDHTWGDVSNGTQTSTPPDGPFDPLPGDGGLGDVPEVRIQLPALPANIALVRQALAGFAEQLGVEASRVADMKIALTEASTNAVVHAYGEEGGPLEVTMAVEHGRLVLTVRDHGHGLQPLPSASEGPPLGFGLALIASLSDEFGIAGGRQGTAVRMAFALGDDDAAPPLAIQVDPAALEPSEQIALALAPGEHGAAVLSRVVSLIAARVDFSIDRLSDAQIVSDAVAGAAGPHMLDGRLAIALTEQPEGFDLVIGPLRLGGAQQLIRDTELPGLGCLLERLTDSLTVEPTGEAEPAGELLRAHLHVRP